MERWILCSVGDNKNCTTSMKLKSDQIFFIGLFSLVLLFFLNAFKVFYFQDDYFFLRISNISQIGDFFKFFSPFKSYFYRPLSSEIFYFFTHIFHNSVFFAHTVVFAMFCIGTLFLYKTVRILTKNRLVSYLTAAIYSIHVTHVFQLYYLGTAQEVFAFLFLAVTFYLFLKKKYTASIVFFILALLSKESAVLFPIFLVAGSLFRIPQCTNHGTKVYLWFVVLSLVALFLYKSGSANVVSNEATYALQFNPRLIANNLLWYSAWSIGFPNFLPDYFVSILKPPLPALWSYFDTVHAKLYICGLLLYILLLTSLSIVVFRSLTQKTNTRLGLFLLFSFILFISPTLPIIHKWMVRLTIPLIFTSFFQAYILYLGLKNKSTSFLAMS